MNDDSRIYVEAGQPATLNDGAGKADRLRHLARGHLGLAPSAFDRWWSGPKGAYLMDYTDCSLLVARNAVSDEAIEALVSQE